MGRSRRIFMTVAVAVLAASGSVIGTGAAFAAGGGSGVCVIAFDQCANGAPGAIPTTQCNSGWINGDLNQSNSQYAEEQVVPQRAVLSVGSGAHSITLQWEDRKGSGPAHAYDSLATWNHTETTADPCQGLSSCPAASPATPSTLAIPMDNTAVPPCSPTGCSDITSAHQLSGQNFVLYGG